MNSDKMRAALAFAVVSLVAATLWMINKGQLQETMRDIALIVVGHILAKFSGVYDFYFGSSDGSKVKNDIIAGQNGALPLTPDMEEH
jgi:hypothetical protein